VVVSYNKIDPLVVRRIKGGAASVISIPGDAQAIII
jgi:hypothetical protein